MLVSFPNEDPAATEARHTRHLAKGGPRKLSETSIQPTEFIVVARGRSNAKARFEDLKGQKTLPWGEIHHAGQPEAGINVHIPIPHFSGKT